MYCFQLQAFFAVGRRFGRLSRYRQNGPPIEKNCTHPDPSQRAGCSYNVLWNDVNPGVDAVAPSRRTKPRLEGGASRGRIGRGRAGPAAPCIRAAAALPSALPTVFRPLTPGNAILGAAQARTGRLRRGAGVVERGGLENRCALCVPWVRIPPSPPLTDFPSLVISTGTAPWGPWSGDIFLGAEQGPKHCTGKISPLRALRRSGRNDGEVGGRRRCALGPCYLSALPGGPVRLPPLSSRTVALASA